MFGTVGARSSVMHGAHTGCESGCCPDASAVFSSNQRIAAANQGMPDYWPTASN